MISRRNKDFPEFETTCWMAMDALADLKRAIFYGKIKLGDGEMYAIDMLMKAKDQVNMIRLDARDKNP